MERVKKGEKYWSFDKYGSIQEYLECGSVMNDYHYESLIYFHTEEETRTMRDKLRTVLKGADVIETPEYDGEYFNAIDEIYEQKGYSKEEYCHMQSFSWGFQEGVEWLESKIVK